MKRFTLFIALLTCVLAGRAQDVCYLIGTDGVFEANHASATLTKNAFGEYVGEVTFATFWDEDKMDLRTHEFTITTKLGETADDWGSIEGSRYCPKAGDYAISLNEEKELFGNYDYKQNLTLALWWEIDKPLWVKVTLRSQSKGSIIIYDSKENDPDFTEDYTPIDLTQGAHFTVTVNEAGSLKQRLESAVFQTDYDLVDYLTVKGKLGGADIAYLQAQEGLVSQLQYLDISQVELVYDDEPYFQYTHGGFYNSHTDIFTLSSENYDEEGSGGMQGQVSVTSTICHRNDLAYAFSKMGNLKECYLPQTLTAIGEHMFSGTPIAKVGMPSAPTYIGDYAFENKNSWYEAPGTLGQIDIPASVRSIGSNAFIGQPIKSVDVSNVTSFGEGCFNLTMIQSIQLNDQVESIPINMFAGCSKLKSINIPANVVEIGEAAFSGCKELATVTMGDKVKKIGAEAFSGCSRLEDMTISPNIEEIGKYAFSSVNYRDSDIPWFAKLPNEDGVKYVGKVAYMFTGGNDIKIKEGTLSVADCFLINHNPYGQSHPSEWGATLTLPSTLRIIGEQAFNGIPASSLTLPESLEKIGTAAFANCTNLRRATIPASVKYIGREAFYNTGLIRVYYNAVDANNEDVEDNGYDIFPESLVRVIIGEGVKSIPNSLFRECKNITRVEMPSTVESIGDYAFAGCTSLTHIDLPSSLKHLGAYAFNGCDFYEIDSYLTEPLDLMVFPDAEKLKEEVDWSEGSEISGGGYRIAGPFSDIEYGFHIDADGNITFGEVSYDDNYNPVIEAGKYTYYHPLPLLRVPNGSLAAYQGDGAWSVLFQQIEQFDGASSTEAVEETTSVTVSNEVTEDTDLSSTMLGSIFVTLDTEDSGDGYNASEGCLVINSTVSDEQLAAATADDADDLTVKNQFSGLIFEVPAGKGSVVIDCQTLGQQAVYVKIGSSDARQLNAANRQQLSIPYDVAETTRIYVYAAKGSAPVASQSARAAYPNDNAVKLYGLTINVDENLSGISAPVTTDRPTTDTWYTLDGRRLVSKPTMTGVYIRNGRKVVVR